MKETIICQGRKLNNEDIKWLNNLICSNTDWSRHRIALELCRLWDWRTAKGQLKNFSARNLLLKLEERGLITLPPVKVSMRRLTWKSTFQEPLDLPDPVSVTESLSDLRPLKFIIPWRGSFEDRVFGYYLSEFHYLGFNRLVGENMKYLVKDCHGRDLACVLFGSAAWKIAPRDRFIGWNDSERVNRLYFLTNNHRFLILPWVRVDCLASHILSQVCKRLRLDWELKYGHSIYLLETFVDCERFLGTCYRASNWIYLGKTKGRSRQDRYKRLRVPIKDIFLYPLVSNFGS